MKIARLMRDGNETYGLITDGNVATKDSIVNQTGVPLPFSIMDFLFEGWYDEIKTKVSTCLLYTSPSPRDGLLSRMPSSA